jgi:hypothetical protein
MNLDQIDALIQEWQEKLRLATDNILEITDLITYKRLAGETGFSAASLEGVTAARVAPALDAMRELWQGLPLLNDAVNKAAALRKSVNRLFPSGDTLKEIERLLTQASIELPPLTNELARRTLLTPTQTDRFVTPEQLLAAMTRGFELSKVILEVDAAWSRLDAAFASAADGIQALRQQAESLQLGPVAELDQAQRKLDTLQVRIQRDPLGVSGDFRREVEPEVQAIRARVAALTAERDQLGSHLNDARRTLDALKDLHCRCEQEWRQCIEDIDGPAPQPRQDPALLDRLGAWLETLQNNFAAGHSAAVCKGLENWRKVAEGFREAEEKAVAAYKGMVDERLELRGMLGVLKNRAQKRRVVEDPELLQLEKEAEYHLYHPRKTPLPEARQLVAAYRSRLNSIAPGGG